VISLLLNLLIISSYAQVELQEGVNYSENTQLEVSSRGVTFKIPSGWYGGLPSGGSAFLMADNSNEISIIVMGEEFQQQQILSELQKEISLDKGITLIPSGTINHQGNSWFGDYNVSGGGQEMKGYVSVKLGDYNIGVACMVIALPSSIERGKKAANEFLNSVRFTKPEQSQVAKGDGINQPWNEYLKGKSLRYYYSKGDFSETDFIHLCSNGSFQRSKQSRSGGITGSGFIAGGELGTWKATGEGNKGSLFLYNQDGTQDEFSVEYGNGPKGVGLHLNGYRYYVEASNQCN
jgi:hypothetical protein